MNYDTERGPGHRRRKQDGPLWNYGHPLAFWTLDETKNILLIAK